MAIEVDLMTLPWSVVLDPWMEWALYSSVNRRAGIRRRIFTEILPCQCRMGTFTFGAERDDRLSIDSSGALQQS